MRLSQAILLGTGTAKLKGFNLHGNGTACALGLAENAIGRVTVNASEHWHRSEVANQWPWLRKWADGGCPTCRINAGANFGLIAHIFDLHVMSGDWTLEQLVDYVRSIEPAEPLLGNSTDCGASSVPGTAESTDHAVMEERN